MSENRTDNQTTLAELKEMVDVFIAERDWHRHHQPKNIAMSIAIEAAELMEIFQWSTVEAGDEQPDADRLAHIRQELSDVLAYSFSLANRLDIDIATAFREKMLDNARRYPPVPRQDASTIDDGAA